MTRVFRLGVLNWGDKRAIWGSDPWTPDCTIKVTTPDHRMAVKSGATLELN